MTIVDTNYLVHLFTNKPPAQARQVLTDLKLANPNSIFMPDYVVSELVYVLEHHTQLAYDRQTISDGLRLILANPVWQCDTELHELSLDKFAVSRLDYVDCLLIAEHQLNRISQVLSFDKKLQTALL